MAYFWYFIGYGFLGYLLEKLFAQLTRSPRRVRKGFLLLPACPVYGLAMCAILALGTARLPRFLERVVLSGAAATAVEYAVHWAYEALFGVRFWDYSATRLDVNGRICLPFSIAWGVLGALAVRFVQPTFVFLAARIPAAVTDTALLCFAVDALWSAGVLLRWGDIALLAPSKLRQRSA